jgi:hypothetical protein
MISRLPRLIAITTAVLLGAGIVSTIMSGRTGDASWVRAFFDFPGALFFVAAAALQAWLSFRCWRRFSAGDVLRPAWFLIGLSAVAQFAGSIVSNVPGLLWFAIPLREGLVTRLREMGSLFSPVYMAFLAAGLWRVLKACRRHGILGRPGFADVLLQAVVVAYTIYFLATVVFAAGHGGRPVGMISIVSWTSDPLLCILLFQAILIRRSTTTMGLGLLSRCWLSFTAAIFLTSLGDIGLWAWSKGFLSHGYEAVSWHIWFLATAAYTMGPAYQLQAMLRAAAGDIQEMSEELVFQ